ncbi:MAG: hypothetical protein ACO3JL_07435 [Myxococcota bacterium]
MIVHRVLDVFFRTLDAVDAVRDRVDQLLGREPRPDPFAAAWPPVEEPTAPTSSQPSGESMDAEASASSDVATKTSRTKKKTSGKGAAASSPARADVKSRSEHSTTKSKTAKRDVAKKAAAPKKASRKGSVDRSGKDVDSARARAVHEYLVEKRLGVVSEDAHVQGKKVLARTLWALRTAEVAGSELGLTTADASALLHLAANMEVFATNIGRACRDHGNLIEESELDGRSRRYRLTDEGRAAAAAIETCPL